MFSWSIHTFWYKCLAEIKSFRKNIFLFSKSSSDLKADFHQQVNTQMKSIIHKWVVNVTPITYPTPMNKSDQYMVKAVKPRFCPKTEISGKFAYGCMWCIRRLGYIHIWTSLYIPLSFSLSLSLTLSRLLYIYISSRLARDIKIVDKALT